MALAMVPSGNHEAAGCRYHLLEFSLFKLVAVVAAVIAGVVYVKRVAG
jgi:hypothetical protein